jgi:UDP-4-amino-4,6-dideoxy-N-acetyl-beta-L-altrosamine N-acetyltransferase
MKRLMDIVDAIELKPFSDLSADESERILAIRNEPEVRQNMYTDHEIALAEHNAWVDRTIKRDDVEMFAVVFDNEIVGAIGLTSIVQAQRRSEWAFYLSTSVQGRGLGSALEFKFLTWVFSDRALHKLNAEVLRFNEPVIALHKKFGFREEGVRRDHIFRNGEGIDAVLLGMTEAEWSEQSAVLRQRLFK